MIKNGDIEGREIVAVYHAENEEEHDGQDEHEENINFVAEETKEVGLGEGDDWCKIVFHSRSSLPVRSINTSSKFACSTTLDFVKPRSSRDLMSFFGVSVATILPLSMMAMRSQSSSASSM